MNRAPYKPGDRIAVLHAQPGYGTCLAVTRVESCHPHGNTGSYRVTYRLAGEAHGDIVDSRGRDKHGYLERVS